ncbi:hypothetical protein [uncultured Erythrobacter sp.]|uniref:hypothetical protein n=1 Tax=uncultured Erythrobacter sp. TaxID=263913 RepID=UPI0026584928|nr:hypothetical protein [uncultured Erythrobacter sp.]
MKKWHLLVALTGSLMVMAAPCAAQKRPAPPKPSIASQSAKPSSSRSPRTASARGQVTGAKAVAQRGKPSLRQQKDNMIRLIGRAEGLKPQRFRLRQQTIDAARTYRADPTTANRSAWRAAARAYMPVRQAHETARGQRDAAIARYRQSKAQRLAAMRSASQAAATPPRLPPQPGRPAVRRQAAVRQLPIRPTAAASAQLLFPTAAPLNGYASGAAAFRAGLPQGPNYSSLNPYVSSAAAFRAALPPGVNYSSLTPAEAGVARQSSSSGTGSVGGTAGSFNSSGTLPYVQLRSLGTLPTLNLVQNAAGGN